jgi:hypothetical protein
MDHRFGDDAGLQEFDKGLALGGLIIAAGGKRETDQQGGPETEQGSAGHRNLC